MKDRVARLKAVLEEKGQDAILVSEGHNRRYLSGFTGSAGHLIISRKEAILATDFRYTEQAGLQAPDFSVTQVSGGIASWLADALSPLGIRTLAFDEGHVTFATYKELTKVAEKVGLELVPDSGTIERLSAIKEPEEVKALERAVALTDESFEFVAADLKPGVTEGEIAWRLEKYIREHGGEGLAFDTIVGGGPNGARPHHRAGERPIQAGEPIVIDMGAKVDGYCADMTRTICLGRADDTMRRVYDIVLGAQLTAEATIAEGMTGSQADGIARQIIEDAGYGDKFGHALGHGIGLEVHEYPRLGKPAQDVLKNNMVFSVEPGIYITGWGGVRIEDLVVMENGKTRVLSKANKVLD
ncbi:MAG: hypothetical protein HW403_928 [Dehalococcoidia bacterium]|nr:hypothetical protein [Dehalococcoidia bacterium]